MTLMASSWSVKNISVSDSAQLPVVAGALSSFSYCMAGQVGIGSGNFTGWDLHMGCQAGIRQSAQ